MQITLYNCLKRARTDTTGFRAWKREIAVAAMAAVLAYFFLPATEIMNEWVAIGCVVVASVVLVPMLEFGWNLAASPVRILNENIETISDQIASLTPSRAQGAPIQPNYAVWGKRSKLRIDEAAMLMAGLSPDGTRQNPTAIEYEGLLKESVSKGDILRADKTVFENKIAAQNGGRSVFIWNNVHHHIPVLMISLLDFLKEEGLAPDFVKEMEPYVSR